MAQKSLPFRLVDSIKTGFRSQATPAEVEPAEPEQPEPAEPPSRGRLRRRLLRRPDAAAEEEEPTSLNPGGSHCVECKQAQAGEPAVCLIHRPPSPKRLVEKGFSSMAEAVAKATEVRESSLRKMPLRKGRLLDRVEQEPSSSPSESPRGRRTPAVLHHDEKKLDPHNAVPKAVVDGTVPEESPHHHHHLLPHHRKQEDSHNAAAAGSGGLCRRAVKGASLGVVIAHEAAKREHEKHKDDPNHRGGLPHLGAAASGLLHHARSQSSDTPSSSDSHHHRHHRLKTGLEVGLLGAAALGVAEAVHHHHKRRKRRESHDDDEGCRLLSHSVTPRLNTPRHHHHTPRVHTPRGHKSGALALAAASRLRHHRHRHHHRLACPLHGHRSAEDASESPQSRRRHATPCPGIRKALAGIGIDQLLQRPSKRERAVSTPKNGSRHHTPLRTGLLAAKLARDRHSSAAAQADPADPGVAVAPAVDSRHHRHRPIFTQTEILRILRGGQSQVSCEDLRGLEERMQRAAEMQAAAESRIQAERSELEAVEEILMRIQREENKLVWHEEETERRLQTLEVLHHHRGRESIGLLRDEARRLKSLISEIEKKVADEEVYEKKRSAEEFGALKHSTTKERESVQAALLELREERQLHLARAKEMRERIFDERRRLDILMDEYRSLEDATHRLQLQLLHFGCPHCADKKCLPVCPCSSTSGGGVGGTPTRSRSHRRFFTSMRRGDGHCRCASKTPASRRSNGGALPHLVRSRCTTGH